MRIAINLASSVCLFVPLIGFPSAYSEEARGQISDRLHYESPWMELPNLWRSCGENIHDRCVIIRYGCNSVTAVRASYEDQARKIIYSRNGQSPDRRCTEPPDDDAVAACIRGACIASPWLH